MTDVQLLLCSALGPKVEEKADFLLRFVYHESLISTLKSLEVDPPKGADFDSIKAEYKKHQAYGILAAAMHLASFQGHASIKPKVDKRVFQSKILGGVIGKGDPKIFENSGPSLRAYSLIEKLVS